MTQTAQDSKAMLWTGRVITTLVVLFLLFDSSIKVAKSAAVVADTEKLGYPVGTIAPIGLALLLSVILYAIPRPNSLGAISWRRNRHDGES